MLLLLQGCTDAAAMQAGSTSASQRSSTQQPQQQQHVMSSLEHYRHAIDTHATAVGHKRCTRRRKSLLRASSV